MTVPASFAPFMMAAPRLFPLMIGTEGRGNSGKSEFILSAPGPGLILSMDRNHWAIQQNPDPPKTRRNDYVFTTVALPTSVLSQEKYLTYWKSFMEKYKAILDVPECRTFGLDGDSDSCELQLQAEFGRTDKILPRTRGPYNAARRLMYAKARDSGKIIIATNKLKPKYETIYVNGVAVKDDQGEEKREWDGISYQRQGFGDYEYCWDIQIRHLYREPRWNAQLKREMPGTYGIKILMCKANRSLEGSELWGEDCNFQGLVQTVYPHIELKDWGY